MCFLDRSRPKERKMCMHKTNSIFCIWETSFSVIVCVVCVYLCQQTCYLTYSQSLSFPHLSPGYSVLSPLCSLQLCVCVCFHVCKGQHCGSWGCMATALPTVVGKVCDAHIREMKQPPAGQRWRQMLRGRFPEGTKD